MFIFCPRFYMACNEKFRNWKSSNTAFHIIRRKNCTSEKSWLTLDLIIASLSSPKGKSSIIIEFISSIFLSWNFAISLSLSYASFSQLPLNSFQISSSNFAPLVKPLIPWFLRPDQAVQNFQFSYLKQKGFFQLYSQIL